MSATTSGSPVRAICDQGLVFGNRHDQFVYQVGDPQPLVTSPANRRGYAVLDQHDVKGITGNDPLHLCQDVVQHLVEVQGAAHDVGCLLESLGQLALLLLGAEKTAVLHGYGGLPAYEAEQVDLITVVGTARQFWPQVVQAHLFLADDQGDAQFNAMEIEKDSGLSRQIGWGLQAQQPAGLSGTGTQPPDGLPEAEGAQAQCSGPTRTNCSPSESSTANVAQAICNRCGSSCVSIVASWSGTMLVASRSLISGNRR